MNVLIAVDNSIESRDAVGTAFRFFGSSGHYTICSVSEHPTVYVSGLAGSGIGSGSEITAQLEAAENAAKEAVRTAADQLPAESEVDVGRGHVGDSIISLASEHAADVIVIGSHDRSFWGRLFDPSVGKYLIDHAPCPVLIVR